MRVLRARQTTARAEKRVGREGCARVVAGFVVVALVLSLSAGLAGASTAGEQADGPVAIDTDDLPGNGTASDPYVVTNASELQAMEEGLDANYTLGGDIDASATATWNNGSGFAPVGGIPSVTGGGLTGSFDGRGHTIANLTIARSDETDIGLFGGVNNNGRVERVTLVNVSISGSERVGALVGTSRGTVSGTVRNGSVGGRREVGGLVGFTIAGVVQHAASGATVDGETDTGGLVGLNQARVENATASTTVETGDGTDNIGGLVGQNTGTVRNTSSAATVSAGSVVGGLVGYNNGGTVAWSYATGSVSGTSRVGGLVGSNTGGALVTRSYATASVTASLDRAGGLAGTNARGATVRRSYAAGAVSASSNSGGLVGVNADATVTNAYWDANTTGQTSSSGETSTAGGTLLTTVEMTGLSARDAMPALEFGQVWFRSPGAYPALTWRYVTPPSPSNDPPAVRPDSYATTANDTLAVDAPGLLGNDSDPEGGPLSVTRTPVTGPANGTVDLAANGSFTYTPDPGFTGWDAFTYEASDTANTTATATVTVRVVPVSEEVPVNVTALSGNGTASDPYVVTNASELQAIEDDIGANYTLGGDIDASGTATWNNGSGFDPVATTPFFDGTGFSGTLDGANHTIANLTIGRASEHVGLFGGLAAEGTVTNVTLAGAVIDGERAVGAVVGSNGGLVRGVTVSGAINGSRSVGGVAGESDSAGQVHGSTAAVTVTGSKNIGGLVGDQAVGSAVENSRATGTISGWKNVGGLVGKQALNAGTTSSTAAATVDGSISVGGLVGGLLGGAVRKSAASGDVNGSRAVGGLVGGNSATVNQSYATTRVNGSDSVGGLVGQNRFDDASVARSYAAGQVTGTNETGGLVGEAVGSGATASGYWDTEATGQDASAGGTPLSTAEMTGAAAPGNMTRLAFPAAWQTRAGDYPGLDWQVNDVPTPDIDAPRWVLAGDSVTLDAGGSSDDRAIVRYEWDVDGDNQTEYTGERVTHAFAGSGNRTVELRATDSAGATGVATQTVRVVANRSLAVSVAAPNAVAVGETVSLTLSLNRSGTKLTDVAWDTDGDNETERAGTSVRTLFQSGGTQTVSATATDVVGREATRAVEIRVTGDADDLIGGHHRFRVDRASTGNSTEVGPVSDISADWTYGVGSRVFSSPVVADGIVYTASYSTSRGDKIVAVNARDGNRLWQFRTTEPVGGNPTVANDTLYIGSDAGVLYALDARTGAKEWSKATGTVAASPVVVDDTLYVTGGSKLHALDPETGDTVFTTQAGGSSPAIANGTIYVGGGSIAAIDAETGEREWTFTEPGGRVASAPAVVNGTVYAGSHDNSLYAVDAATGTKEWAFETGDIVRSSPAVADGTVYVGSDDGFVYAVDAATGDKDWAFETSAESIFGEPDNRVSSSPVVASNTVYIGNDGYYVYALNATDGTERWSYVTNFDVGATPAVADGHVYAGSVDGSLYALSGSTPTGGAPPPVVGDNEPQDSDDDGLYEDVRGDGSLDVFDVQTLFANLDSPTVQTNAVAFNFQGTNPDEVTIFDVQALFARV